VPNRVERDFHSDGPYKLLLSDISEFSIPAGKVYLSPDNAACEGLFGRVKNEFFYNQDWKDTTIEEFIQKLDEYLHWYNEKRIKKSLGYLSPIEYRRTIGLAA